jgi:hypothetical protein
MRNPQQTAKACLYTPEMMYIGLLHAMGQQNMLMKRPMATLSQLVVKIVQEKRRIILDKGGVRICKSLYVPYSAMQAPELALLEDMVQTHGSYTNSGRCSCQQPEQTDACEIILDDNSEVIGVGTLLCAVLLLLRHTCPAATTNTHSIFDVVLQDVMSNFRVDYAVTLRECVAYGYCPE